MKFTRPWPSLFLLVIIGKTLLIDTYKNHIFLMNGCRTLQTSKKIIYCPVVFPEQPSHGENGGETDDEHDKR